MPAIDDDDDDDDDDYTVQYYEESTIDNEYLNKHDKVKKWFENSLRMSVLHEECCSVCSPNLTNEKMLDYIVHGHSARNKNRNSLSTYSAGCYTDSEDYNTTGMTKTKDTGYYSESNESLTSDNGPYMLESAAFRKTAPSKTPKSVQKESHFVNAIKGKTHVHSVSSQTTVYFPLSHAIKSQHQTRTQTSIETDNKTPKSYSCDSATYNYYILSPVEVLEEETNENITSPTVFKEDNFAHTPV